MKPLFAAVLAIFVVGTNLLSAQAPPESEKLNYFAGTWKLEIHLRESPVSGKVFFGTEHNEWLSGRSLLLSRQEEPNVFGGAGVAVMAYDRTAKTYKYHQMKSSGAEEDLFGTFKDGTWTWTSNETAQTKQAPKTRLIMKELNDSSYSLSLETASDGQEWFVVMEGIATKIIPHSHQDSAFLR